MIPFALANKEEVTDSYKMGFILDLIIPFLLSFTFFLTLLSAEKYIKSCKICERNFSTYLCGNS
ncbi:hypothetical protein CGC50_01560 [Capnocytophaga gingivalis]|jgi:hypothetical protein|uniref:Uncharacterized protein n=1 Tax=Capnocytophaga gingivalis TaxID=1017 RepID=A0A250FNI5_9FLAO|nr:hypothetical protein CGC50_01560 [Capnocytophaga gingivalis]